MTPVPIRTRAGFALRWRTLAGVGVRMMLHDKLKLLGTLAGVVFATLLSNQQAGTFLGLLYKNEMYVVNAGADIFIAPPGAEAFQGGKPISEASVVQARAVPGVAWAEPLLFGASTLVMPNGGAEAVQVIGTKAPYLRGGPWNVVVGDRESLRLPDVMFFETADRLKYGGLNIGSTRELGGKKVVVGGFTWGLLPFGASFAFADYALAQQILHTPADQTSFGLVGVAEGEDPARVAAALRERLVDVKVMTRDEYRSSIVRYILTRTAIGLTLGISTAFGLLIGFVIVALTMFSTVLDNVREFGTLKAIGANTPDLARLLVVQAVCYALAGSLVGLSLVNFIADRIRSPQLALVLPWQLSAGTAVLMVLMCIAASGLALFRLRSVEPGMVFR